MPATVRINYDRYVNAGVVPSTDFENSIMEDILVWADETLHPDTKIALSDLIVLYWAIQLGEYELVSVEDDEEDFE